MLQIKDICKEYRTGGLTQQALDHVNLSFRDSEFVAILGPSGSGKTTLLNIIGGLDRYDSGDLIINGVSTKRYTDRDWDTYRNHTIGFIFQSYNLIPHQTILANVELTLTVSGVSRAERREREPSVGVEHAPVIAERDACRRAQRQHKSPPRGRRPDGGCKTASGFGGTAAHITGYTARPCTGRGCRAKTRWSRPGPAQRCTAAPSRSGCAAWWRRPAGG